MNKKKAGLVSAGVLTALVAASPLAWAVGPSQQAPEDCSFSAQGGDAYAPDGPDQPLNAVLQAPVANDNAGIFGQCSTFNNNNGEGNGLGNTFNGQEIPAPPSAGELPGLPGGLPGGLPTGLPTGLPG